MTAGTPSAPAPRRRPRGRGHPRGACRRRRGSCHRRLRDLRLRPRPRPRRPLPGAGRPLPRPALPPALAARTTACGRSARSGCTRRGSSPTSRSSPSSTRWRPRATATSSRSASRPCWPPSSTTRTPSTRPGPGRRCGSCAAASWAPAAEAAPPRSRATSTTPRRGPRRPWSTRWRHGGSPVLRSLRDAGVVELLGGPATHPFLPLLLPELADVALRVGLDDSRGGSASARAGIWSPECGYRPGLGRTLAAAGVATSSSTSRRSATRRRPPRRRGRVGRHGRRRGPPRPRGHQPHLVLPLAATPAAAAYRDFHGREPSTGARLWAVTGPDVPSSAKAPYDPDAAAAQVTGTSPPSSTAVPDRLRRCATSAAARDGRRGLRHRAVRALVARGPGVPRRGRAGAARGRRAGHHGREGPGAPGTSPGTCDLGAPGRGARARTSPSGTARRCPRSWRTTRRCNGAGSRSCPRARRWTPGHAAPGPRPAAAHAAQRAEQRLGVHGHPRPGGRLRPAPVRGSPGRRPPAGFLVEDGDADGAPPRRSARPAPTTRSPGWTPGAPPPRCVSASAAPGPAPRR